MGHCFSSSSNDGSSNYRLKSRRAKSNKKSDAYYANDDNESCNSCNSSLCTTVYDQETLARHEQAVIALAEMRDAGKIMLYYRAIMTDMTDSKNMSKQTGKTNMEKYLRSLDLFETKLGSVRELVGKGEGV